MPGAGGAARLLGLAFGILFLPQMPVAHASPGLYRCMGETATIVGTNADDNIRGTDGPDVIVARRGADRVEALGGDDLVCLGPGGTYDGAKTEVVLGGGGNDRVSGGPGTDHIYGGRGSDLLRGGGGRDRIFGEEGSDLVDGGGGADDLDGGDGDDVVRGGEGSDTLSGDAHDDRLLGGGHGRKGDTVSYYYRYQDRQRAYTAATAGADVDLGAGIARSDGRDTLRGIENITGTDHDDRLIGDDRSNLIHGLSGDDLIGGGGGSDCVEAGLGMNEVDGGPGFDYVGFAAFNCQASQFSGFTPTIGVTVDLEAGYATFDLEEDENRTNLTGVEGAYGTPYPDALTGDSGVNRLFGGGGNDRLEGRAGDDHLDGGAGRGDRVDGGDGVDTCFGEVLVFCEQSEELIRK